ncbi:carotenoid 9,10(9',10')-cleavage dioxygenase-like isoform X1 [Triticum urartu]|uniref:carotenoid 9,10(9',10')-cleavage dioxygenase-like isoform X1 n=2 Tax=Triticum urartu TaxID=4572 RepID=UPI002043BA83|nr:carotenoid 9,10(9',10')-cleavage dioxygenase-like isoform X1 [Triticum urartu]
MLKATTSPPHALRPSRACYRPAFSLSARTSSSPLTSNPKKSLIQELQRQLSSRINDASLVLKNAPQRLLDAIVDSTFKFTHQALLPSESNFAPVDEIGGSVEILQIEGEIPKDFPEGVYIRNGSNPLFGALHSTVSVFGESSEIWVEGEGMLHALYFTKTGSASSWSVSYDNRYVQSETLKIEQGRQKPCFLPAIEGDSAAIIVAYILNYLRFGKVNKNITNTNVFEHAGRVYAVAESHQPQEICIQNLETGNTWDIGGEWDRPFTAHPKVAPGSGELVIFGSDAKKPFLVVGVVSDDGTKLKHKVDLKLNRSTLCHDIGVTLKYNIIIDIPLTIDIGRLTTGGQLIEFEKEGYARIGIMPRYGDAESVMWFDVEPFCMFHLINCFEEGDEVVVQGLRSADSVIPGPRLNKQDILPERSELKKDGKAMKQGINEKLFSRLFEWRLNLRTKTVSGEYLTGTECSLEFPMINNHYTGVRHSYGYAQIVDSLTRSAGSSEKVLPKYGGFAKLCLEERENTEVCINQLRASVQLLFNQDFLTQIQAVHQTSAEDLIKMEIHRLSEDEFCSGASFVQRVGGSHEDDGWIISFVHNERTNTSQVHIIDTQKFEGAPVAKITLPQRVPYGFHGTFVHNNIHGHVNTRSEKKLDSLKFIY